MVVGFTYDNTPFLKRSKKIKTCSFIIFNITSITKEGGTQFQIALSQCLSKTARLEAIILRGAVFCNGNFFKCIRSASLQDKLLRIKDSVFNFNEIHIAHCT